MLYYSKCHRWSDINGIKKNNSGFYFFTRFLFKEDIQKCEFGLNKFSRKNHVFFNDVYRIENESGKNRLQEKNSKGIEMKEINQSDDPQEDINQTLDSKDGQTDSEEETESETDPLILEEELR